VVFSSTAFLFVFLPLVLLLVYPLPRAWQNPALLVASVAFYIWGAGDDVVVIASVALVSWLAALAVAYAPRWCRPLVFLVSCLVILAPLLFFKYVPVLRQFAWDEHTAARALPLGISFFTFHALSYVIDVRRGTQRPDGRADHYALYLFLFPHQIAGPIVRYSEIRDEIAHRLRARTEDVAYGLARFGWGLAKKVMIGDVCGTVAGALWNPGMAAPNASTAWIGALAYTLQIYFDFSGYSDMAIGLARVFNFHFPENFAGPYRSWSATEFWRRWHMTLSRWFRDYVYIPLGGNRHGPEREYFALITTFGLTSLWHGATWPFLIWGGVWSAALTFERITGLRRSPSLIRLRRAAMAVFIVFSWVPFRSATATQAWTIWKAMFTGGWG